MSSALTQTIQKVFATIKLYLLDSSSLSPASKSQASKIQPSQKTVPTASAQTAISLPATLQNEIRRQRKFSLSEAIGRESGSFMKGESTIPRPLRATAQINQFINAHIKDSTSAFSTTLQSWACNDIRVSRQLDTPLVALDQMIASLLLDPTSFYEFARQVAIAHSQLTGDRPYFQQPNQPPYPKADYTHASIRAELTDLQQHLHAALQTVAPLS